MRKVGKSPISKLKKEADTALQKWGRNKYQRSLISNSPCEVLHHFVPKSVSNRLRYDIENLIPLSNTEHYRLHQSPDPEIESRIIQIKGQKWLKYILKAKHEIVKTDRFFYQTALTYFTFY